MKQVMNCLPNLIEYGVSHKPLGARFRSKSPSILGSSSLSYLPSVSPFPRSPGRCCDVWCLGTTSSAQKELNTSLNAKAREKKVELHLKVDFEMF